MHIIQKYSFSMYLKFLPYNGIIEALSPLNYNNNNFFFKLEDPVKFKFFFISMFYFVLEKI